MSRDPVRGSVVRLDVTGLAAGSEAGAAHPIPAVVVQADRYRYGRTLMVVPFTTNILHARDPRGVPLHPTKANGLSRESVAMCWQVMAVDRDRILGPPIGRVSSAGMDLIAKNIAILVDCQPGYLQGSS